MEEFMAESGMKKNKEIIKMDLKIKVLLKLVPFGSIQYETAGHEGPTEENPFEIPRYIEPPTTHVEKVEILYQEGENYSVPKKTVGT